MHHCKSMCAHPLPLLIQGICFDIFKYAAKSLWVWLKICGKSPTPRKLENNNTLIFNVFKCRLIEYSLPNYKENLKNECLPVIIINL